MGEATDVNPYAAKARGWRKLKLIRQLAEGERTLTELARQYDMTVSGVSQFVDRNEVEIEEVRRSIIDEFAALWVSSKFNRLAEYQSDIERIDHNLAACGDDLFTKEAQALLKLKMALLRQVADEMGQLPPRREFAGNGVNVVHQYVGLPSEALTLVGEVVNVEPSVVNVEHTRGETDTRGSAESDT